MPYRFIKVPETFCSVVGSIVLVMRSNLVTGLDLCQAKQCSKQKQPTFPKMCQGSYIFSSHWKRKIHKEKIFGIWYEVRLKNYCSGMFDSHEIYTFN